MHSHEWQNNLTNRWRQPRENTALSAKTVLSLSNESVISIAPYLLTMEWLQ